MRGEIHYHLKTKTYYTDHTNALVLFRVILRTKIWISRFTVHPDIPGIFFSPTCTVNREMTVVLPEGLSMEILYRNPNYNLKSHILVDHRLKYIAIQIA